MIISSLASF